MGTLLNKMNYKGYDRLAIIDAPPEVFRVMSGELKGVMVDTKVDPRFLYEFLVLFAENLEQLKKIAPLGMNNIAADGKLWICYPKKSSKNYRSDIDRDHGWEPLTQNGFAGVRMISIDDDWSAFRFRNTKYIKTKRPNQ